MADRAFCIHGHFYQPPREDPLTGEIPREPGASPYNNWNERIHAQCYYPNALLGNFARVSFNMGPTLLEWMFDYDPETESRIIQQARSNLEIHQAGNAMAQAYNHTILPLAKRHDKITQVRWGMADFELRFGYRAEGIWLPETAVDEETLAVVAQCGVRFIILAPWQADLASLNTPVLDTTHPYRVIAEGGKELAVFFYDQELSTRVSFDPASTINADNFFSELVLPKFNHTTPENDQPQLVLVASDGELYGHHQKFRDKFLAYLMDGGVRRQEVEVTFPALWLRKHPPTQVVRVRPFTSWSCHHGVLRWSGNCNCTPHSEWKAPFRQALDRLADAVDEEYLKVAGAGMPDPWELRHQYIRVVHGEINLPDLVEMLSGSRPDPQQLRKIHYLLRAQYERQRMFTSCGWFFDDFDRIEPRNNVAYAAQAVWLTKMATGADLSELAQTGLARVKSWRSGVKADAVFRKHYQRASEQWTRRE